MQNISAKYAIWGSLLVLLLLALAGGVYIWTNSSLKIDATVNTGSTTTKTTTSSANTTPTASTVKQSITSSDLDSNGKLKDSALFSQ